MMEDLVELVNRKDKLSHKLIQQEAEYVFIFSVTLLIKLVLYIKLLLIKLFSCIEITLALVLIPSHWSILGMKK